MTLKKVESHNVSTDEITSKTTAYHDDALTSPLPSYLEEWTHRAK
jgi:hypothetical protein